MKSHQHRAAPGGSCSPKKMPASGGARSAAMAILGLLAFSGICLSQALSRGLVEQRLNLLRETANRDLRSLQNYTWQQRTEFLSKGKIRSFRIDDVGFAADGSIRRVAVGGSGVSAGQAKKFVDYMDRMMSLAERYMYLDSGLLLKAFDAGGVTVTQRPGSDRARVRVRDYFKPGDSLELMFDTTNKQIREIEAYSYLDRPKGVEINVDFALLPDGANYAASVSVKLEREKIELRTQAKGHRLARTN